MVPSDTWCKLSSHIIIICKSWLKELSSVFLWIAGGWSWQGDRCELLFFVLLGRQHWCKKTCFSVKYECCTSPEGVFLSPEGDLLQLLQICSWRIWSLPEPLQLPKPTDNRIRGSWNFRRCKPDWAVFRGPGMLRAASSQNPIRMWLEHSSVRIRSLQIRPNPRIQNSH